MDKDLRKFAGKYTIMWRYDEETNSYIICVRNRINGKIKTKPICLFTMFGKLEDVIKYTENELIYEFEREGGSAE
jgi:hypothetical protein